MSLWKKIIRLFRGTAHDAVDSVSNPEVVGRQIIREMDEKIRNGEEGLLNLQAQLALIEADRNKCDSEIEKLTGAAKKALQNGNESLAHEIASRIADITVQRDSFNENICNMAESIKDLDDQLKEALSTRADAVHSINVASTKMQVARAQETVANAVSDIGASDGMSEISQLIKNSEAAAAKASARVKRNNSKSGKDLLNQVDKLNKPSADDILNSLRG